MEELMVQDDWILWDCDNPYRIAYYGGYLRDDKLPYMTDDLTQAWGFPDEQAAEDEASAIFDRYERGFMSSRRLEWRSAEVERRAELAKGKGA